MVDIGSSGSRARFPFAVQDLLASVVVFLVALPLCIGIALAAGMPPASGLITGIVGGIVVCSLGGCALQVSGPAAGLVVLVAELIEQNGIDKIGVIIALAGLMQIAAGTFGLARWFRAVPPSVINGMLAGIGVLIFAGQFHVMVDDTPRANGIANLISIPQSIYKGIMPSLETSHHEAAIIGLLTIVTLLGWQKFGRKIWPAVPGHLVAVLLATIVATLSRAQIHHVTLPANLLEAVKIPSMDTVFAVVQDRNLWLDAAAMALIASAETLLTASALDKMHSGPSTDYNRELRAQGIGNTICGFLGVMPLTGVMARSGVNVSSGAKTRLSAVLHGCWLLIFVVFFGSITNLIPTASLAALLVYTGFKLIDFKALKELAKHGRGEVGVYAVTVASIVSIDLLTGVLLGIGLAILKLSYSFSHLEVKLLENVHEGKTDLWLRGSATFLNLPKLAEALDQVRLDMPLHVHVEGLEYVDHACLDLLMSWEKRCQGRDMLVIDWDALGTVYRDRRNGSRSDSDSRRHIRRQSLEKATSGEQVV